MTSRWRLLRSWWQVQTGKDDTPLDGGTPYWIFSVLLHVALLGLLSVVLISPVPRKLVDVQLDPIEPPIEFDLAPPEIRFDESPHDEVGSDSALGAELAQSVAMTAADLPEVELDTELELREAGEILFNESELPPVADQLDAIQVNGTVGVAATGAAGAVDRITQEIVTSLEERKTLVVWMFDQSASLTRQRAQIIEQFDRVYEELGMLEASGARAFAQYDGQPLLTQIVAFGETMDYAFREPTESLTQIKEAARSITTDDSGVENVFAAIAAVVQEYRALRHVDGRTGERARNVMIVVVSDEAGDDVAMIDAAVAACKKYLVPVYVIGVPAPFGKQETEVKWVDPDPNFDQTPQWTTVRQGPESLYPERLNLAFGDAREDLEYLDSGFGPFGLTRVCFESGGIYFAVHPNRGSNGLRRWQTSEFAAYLTHFFDAQVMRVYRPDYVSVATYQKALESNRARMALVQACQQSWLTSLETPQLEFPKFDDADFVTAITLAQRTAASLEPKIERLFQILATGEADREIEIAARWKAGYDLAYGRVLAAKVRAEAYNAMLAMAKTTLRFSDPNNNTWRLVPADRLSAGSPAEQLAEKARQYLRRVVAEHPQTPWALLASEELKAPIGWEWRESFTPPPEPPPEPSPTTNNNNRNNAPSAPPRPATPPPPKPRRPAPKL